MHLETESIVTESFSNISEHDSIDNHKSSDHLPQPDSGISYSKYTEKSNKNRYNLGSQKHRASFKLNTMYKNKISQMKKSQDKSGSKHKSSQFQSTNLEETKEQRDLQKHLSKCFRRQAESSNRLSYTMEGIKMRNTEQNLLKEYGSLQMSDIKQILNESIGSFGSGSGLQYYNATRDLSSTPTKMSKGGIKIADHPSQEDSTGNLKLIEIWYPQNDEDAIAKTNFQEMTDQSHTII